MVRVYHELYDMLNLTLEMCLGTGCNYLANTRGTMSIALTKVYFWLRHHQTEQVG